MKRLLTVVCLIGLYQLGYAQSPADTIREVSASRDSLNRRYDWRRAAALNKPFPIQSFILPAAIIGYGAAALRSKTLQKLNSGAKEEIWEDNPHKPFHLDNYLMFAPTLSVYTLNAAGI